MDGDAFGRNRKAEIGYRNSNTARLFFVTPYQEASLGRPQEMLQRGSNIPHQNIKDKGRN